MTAGSSHSGAFVPGVLCERGHTGRGVLDGVRLAVKDLIDVQGATTGGGNPGWAASHPAAATSDAACVAALRMAGARVVGKTVTDELAFSLEGENAFHGTPRHPLAADRLPGGSSSGSVVAVAWGEADVALGTDTGGSVRVPASFCGVAAMRPTHGRVPLAGVLPFAPSYDTVGWFARDAALLRSAGHALLGSAAGSRAPLRLCIAEDAMALADAPVREALHAWAQQAGIVETRQAFSGEWATWAQAYAELQGHEIAEQLGPWIRQARPAFGAAIAPRFEQALALDAAQRPRWQAWRAQAAQRLVRQLGADEAWLVPAAPCVALQKSADAAERSHFYARALAIGSLAGHAGLPQVVLPLASTQGLPVGISFMAAPGQDERLLDLATTFSENGRFS